MRLPHCESNTVFPIDSYTVFSEFYVVLSHVSTRVRRRIVGTLLRGQSHQHDSVSPRVAICPAAFCSVNRMSGNVDVRLDGSGRDGARRKSRGYHER